MSGGAENLAFELCERTDANVEETPPLEENAVVVASAQRNTLTNPLYVLYKFGFYLCVVPFRVELDNNNNFIAVKNPVQQVKTLVRLKRL